MTKRRREPELEPQWTVHMRLVYRVAATVAGATLEEATANAKAANFIDDGLRGGELVDWDVTSKPTKDL